MKHEIPQDALNALNAIAQHRHTILEAFLNHRSVIPETDENQAAIRSLRKHHLVWQLSEHEPPRLNRTLVTLAQSVTQNYRLSTDSVGIGHLWTEIVNTLDRHSEAQRQGAHEDAELYVNDACDLGYQLIEGLRSAITRFTYHLNNGFTYIKNLEIRAQENQRMIDQTKGFNDILFELDVELSEQQTRESYELNMLLRQSIPKALDDCRKNLIFAIDKLSAVLHSIQEQQRQSKLINSILELYQQNPLFTPSLEEIAQFPVFATRIQPIKIEPKIWVDHPEHEEQLIEAVESLPSRQLEEEKAEEGGQPIQDMRNDPAVEIETDPIQVAIQILLEHVVQNRISISALDAMEAFDIECEHIDQWLSPLIAQVTMLEQSLQSQCPIRIIYKETVHPDFNGNFTVFDVELEAV